MLLMPGRVKKRSAPALDKVLTGLLGSGQAVANVTFQVYPGIWRHGHCDSGKPENIPVPKRDGEEARGAGSFLSNAIEQRQAGRARNRFKGAGRVQTGGGTQEVT